MRWQASAPGKLVLLGEYAVLSGAPAIVVAAGPRAQVRVDPQAAYPHSLETLGGESFHSAFDLAADGAVHWRHPDARTARGLALLGGILDGLIEMGWVRQQDLPASAIRIDTSAFFRADGHGGTRKLGFGSSAALTVAFAGALAARGAHAPASDRAQSLAGLCALHGGVQQGRGSGVDIAASLVGGSIVFERDASGTPCARPQVLPQGLVMLGVWTGQSASTGHYLRAYEAWGAADPQAQASALAEMERTARGAVRALEGRDCTAFLASIADYAACLRRLGTSSGLDIYSPVHKRIATIVAGTGAVYKPSGAGGGDMGVAFAAHPGRIAHAGELLAAEGLHCMPLEVDPLGLRVEQSRE